MSSSHSIPALAVNVILGQVAAQLDGTTAVVKIPTSVFKELNEDGKASIKRTLSSILGHPVDFYLDVRSNKRVYLANIANINLLWPCEAWKISGLNLKLLLPMAITGPKIMNTPSRDIQQSNLSLPPQAPGLPSLQAAQSNVAKGSKRARESENPAASSKSGADSSTGRKKRKNLDPKPLNAFTPSAQRDCVIPSKEFPGTNNQDISQAHGMRLQAVRPEKTGTWEVQAAAPLVRKNISASNTEPVGEQQSLQDLSQRAVETIHQKIHNQCSQAYQTSPPSPLYFTSDLFAINRPIQKPPHLPEEEVPAVEQHPEDDRKLFEFIDFDPPSPN
ncbi:hypothetical protein E0Z10_g2187 [Xylaria hypoxylon]|uniref:Uncharacterized protein n=1 Tax=Xylaria hypoxylon TaxID=37992 RepID=A0A4Z0Z339_9PEZI|nr:hypothetical protein E0Z10_g2187 [Xylaria hypoxylon]